jgi:hypothetical protein
MVLLENIVPNLSRWKNTFHLCLMVDLPCYDLKLKKKVMIMAMHNFDISEG